MSGFIFRSGFFVCATYKHFGRSSISSYSAHPDDIGLGTMKVYWTWTKYTVVVVSHFFELAFAVLYIINQTINQSIKMCSASVDELRRRRPLNNMNMKVGL